MDHHRFDTLVKHLTTLQTRRNGLRILLAGLVAGSVGLDSADESVGKKKRKRRGKKGKKKSVPFVGPPVPCREVGESCNPQAQGGIDRCCGCPMCEHDNAEICRMPAKLECFDAPIPGPRCCNQLHEPCANDCDCCELARCDGGSCETPPCKNLREECVFATDCCDGGEVGEPRTCQNNSGTVPDLPDRYCCVLPGFGADSACTDDVDCCGVVGCFDGICGGP